MFKPRIEIIEEEKQTTIKVDEQTLVLSKEAFTSLAWQLANPTYLKEDYND